MANFAPLKAHSLCLKVKIDGGELLKRRGEPKRAGANRKRLSGRQICMMLHRFVRCDPTKARRRNKRKLDSQHAPQACRAPLSATKTWKSNLPSKRLSEEERMNELKRSQKGKTPSSGRGAQVPQNNISLPSKNARARLRMQREAKEEGTRRSLSKIEFDIERVCVVEPSKRRQPSEDDRLLLTGSGVPSYSRLKAPPPSCTRIGMATPTR